jgi:hypothetical protein
MVRILNARGHLNPRLSMGKVQGREYERVQALQEDVRNLQSAILRTET